MSSDKDEESGYEHNLNLLIFLCILCALYPTRIGCKEIIASLRSTYLKMLEAILKLLKVMMALRLR